MKYVRVCCFATALGLALSGGLFAPTTSDNRSSQLLLFHDSQSVARTVTTEAEWAKRRAEIMANMQKVMGEFPRQIRRLPLDVKVTEEVQTLQFTRKKLTYVAEPGDRVPAYLFLPRSAERRSPAILCLHQTTPLGKAEPAGMGPSADMSYALELASRGYVVLAPDYPSFGEYPYDFRRSRHPSGTMKAIWNNIRAVDLLQSLREADADRIGCLGHSLGGHNALFTAAFDAQDQGSRFQLRIHELRKILCGKSQGLDERPIHAADCRHLSLEAQ